jgi:hypothetical protein
MPGGYRSFRAGASLEGACTAGGTNRLTLDPWSPLGKRRPNGQEGTPIRHHPGWRPGSGCVPWQFVLGAEAVPPRSKVGVR